MANIPELLNGHVTLQVECLDRLYLNGYIGRLATAGGLVTFMREQLGKPIPSPVVLGQVTEHFREEVRAKAERDQIPIYQFQHKERKDDVANRLRQQRGIRDEIVFIGVAQEKAQAFSGRKISGQFEFTRDKCVFRSKWATDSGGMWATDSGGKWATDSGGMWVQVSPVTGMLDSVTGTVDSVTGMVAQ